MYNKNGGLRVNLWWVGGHTHFKLGRRALGDPNAPIIGYRMALIGGVFVRHNGLALGSTHDWSILPYINFLKFVMAGGRIFNIGT